MFRLDTEGNLVTATNAWTGVTSFTTGWTATHFNYKIFVYGARTSTVSLRPTFGYANERVMMYVDGEPLAEAVTNFDNQQIPVDEDGTSIELRVNSEKYHAQQLADGVEDPFAEPEATYTIYVEMVRPHGQILKEMADRFIIIRSHPCIHILIGQKNSKVR